MPNTGCWLPANRNTLLIHGKTEARNISHLCFMLFSWFFHVFPWFFIGEDVFLFSGFTTRSPIHQEPSEALSIERNQECFIDESLGGSLTAGWVRGLFAGSGGWVKCLDVFDWVGLGGLSAGFG